MKILLKFSFYKTELETFDKVVAVRQPTNMRTFITEYASTRGIPLVILFKHLGNIEEQSEYEDLYGCQVVE